LGAQSRIWKITSRPTRDVSGGIGNMIEKFPPPLVMPLRSRNVLAGSGSTYVMQGVPGIGVGSTGPKLKNRNMKAFGNVLERVNVTLPPMLGGVIVSTGSSASPHPGELTLDALAVHGALPMKPLSPPCGPLPLNFMPAITALKLELLATSVNDCAVKEPESGAVIAMTKVAGPVTMELGGPGTLTAEAFVMLPTMPMGLRSAALKEPRHRWMDVGSSRMKLGAIGPVACDCETMVAPVTLRGRLNRTVSMTAVNELGTSAVVFSTTSVSSASAES
jgi:hypothetical protein